MPSTLLSLATPTTGTESGTWGDLVNNGLTSYLDIAIAGGLSVSITTADVTLTNTSGTNAATGITSTTAQYAILNISGAKTAARNLNLPASSREYTINNAGTGGFLLTVRGVTPTTGVTLVDGERAIVAWNGTDYVKVASSLLTALSGTLAVANGGTGVTTSTGTGATVLSTSPTLVTPLLGTPTSGVMTNVTGLPLTTGVTGTLPVANGGTGVTTSTGSGANVLATSPTLVTPILGTPTSGTLTNATGLPLTTGVTGTLPVANGGTGVTTSTGVGSSVVLGATHTTFTPAVTFGIPGDLSVTYGVRQGSYARLGNIVYINIYLATNTFTYTTASNNFKVTGLPVSSSSSYSNISLQAWVTYTKSGFTQVFANLSASSTELLFYAVGSGTGSTPIALLTSDIPSGTNIFVQVSGFYFV